MWDLLLPKYSLWILMWCDTAQINGCKAASHRVGIWRCQCGICLARRHVSWDGGGEVIGTFTVGS